MTGKARINFKNVMAYIIGNIRFRLFYSKYRFLIPTHIHEQIDFRIKFMKKACYENGECVICGCQTTALQMANKSCDEPCYPPMMSKSRWVSFLKGEWVKDRKGIIWLYSSSFNMLYSRKGSIFTEIRPNEDV